MRRTLLFQSLGSPEILGLRLSLSSLSVASTAITAHVHQEVKRDHDDPLRDPEPHHGPHRKAALATPDDDDPLPDPEPDPGPEPSDPEPTDPFPGVPPSGPVGPGS